MNACLVKTLLKLQKAVSCVDALCQQKQHLQMQNALLENGKDSLSINL
jgi:hypothetical protein